MSEAKAMTDERREELDKYNVFCNGLSECEGKELLAEVVRRGKEVERLKDNVRYIGKHLYIGPGYVEAILAGEDLSAT